MKYVRVGSGPMVCDRDTTDVAPLFSNLIYLCVAFSGVGFFFYFSVCLSVCGSGDCRLTWYHGSPIVFNRRLLTIFMGDCPTSRKVAGATFLISFFYSYLNLNVTLSRL